MKTYFLLGCFLFFFQMAIIAQGIRLEGGINFSNVSVTDEGRVDEARTLTSFHAGLRGDVPVAGPLYLQPAVLFTGKGSKTSAGDPASGTYYRATSKPYYIEVPVNFVVKTPKSGSTRFFAGAGPYLAIGVGGRNAVQGSYLGIGFSGEEAIRFSDDDPSTLGYEEGAGFGVLKRFDYGINGTAGLEGKSLTLSVNYGLGLAKLQSGSDSGENDRNKHRVLSFTLGFSL